MENGKHVIWTLVTYEMASDRGIGIGIRFKNRNGIDIRYGKLESALSSANKMDNGKNVKYRHDMINGTIAIRGKKLV